MATVAAYVSYTSPRVPKTTLSAKQSLIEEWRKLIKKCNLGTLSRKPIEEALKSAERFSQYLDENAHYFIVEHKPALRDPISHIKGHFNALDNLVKQNELSPEVATEIMYLNYLYDSVHQLLFVSTYRPADTDDPSLEIEVLSTPSELFDWMFKLDYLILTLSKHTKEFQNKLLNELKASARKFLKDALNLGIFSPISTRDIFTDIKSETYFWSQKFRPPTRFQWLLAYLYDRVRDYIA